MKPALKLPPEAAFAEIDTHTAALAAGPDARTRLKVARALAFAGASLALGKAALSPEGMERGLKALALARASGATNENLGRAIAVLSKRRLEALGLLDAPVLAETRVKVEVKAGCLALSGAALAPGWSEWNDRALLDEANAGRSLVVPIGSDGVFRLTLRLIGASEPALKPAEYKTMVDATPVIRLNLPGQTLYAGAPEALLQGARLEAKAPSARAQVFLMEAASGPHFVVAACASDAPAPVLTTLPAFQL